MQWGGHSSGYRNTINTTFTVVMGKMCTLLTVVTGLLQHGTPYSYIMTVLSFVSISIHQHHNEQQDAKVISVLVRLQTSLVLYKFPSLIHDSAVVWKELLQ